MRQLSVWVTNQQCISKLSTKSPYLRFGYQVLSLRDSPSPQDYRIDLLWPCDATWYPITWSTWFRQWLDAWRHQATTWTNVDETSARAGDVIPLRAVPQVMLNTISLIRVWHLLIYDQPHIPGSNDLTHSGLYSSFKIKLHLLSTVLLSGIQSSPGAPWALKSSE